MIRVRPIGSQNIRVPMIAPKITLVSRSAAIGASDPRVCAPQHQAVGEHAQRAGGQAAERHRCLSTTSRRRARANIRTRRLCSSISAI